ncbi:MAG: hypothetical protein KU37_06915 [Sulfuricurvum sp. PC08-66]|nr:MAG: hypothetical protein KU37_06915 [Sulfuricurvum sp. PC08-66]
MKVLIIEDNWMLAHVIEDVAGMTGMQVVGMQVVGIASSWAEAAQLLEDAKPDMAVVDININGPIDGIEVARRLKARGIASLFLTAYKDVQTIKEAAQVAPLGYLVKPVTPENLMATLMVILEKERPQTPASEMPYSVSQGCVYHEGQLLALSKYEHLLLSLLLKHLGHPVGYDMLYGADISMHNEASLRNSIAKLRKKCPDMTIQNLKDIGYIASINA